MGWTALLKREYIRKRYSVIQNCSRPKLSRACGLLYSPIQGLCLCWPLRLETPCTWNYYPCHLSSRRDDLRLSCLLTQALILRAHSFPRQNLTNSTENLVNSAAHRVKADEIPRFTAVTQLN